LILPAQNITEAYRSIAKPKFHSRIRRVPKKVSALASGNWGYPMKRISIAIFCAILLFTSVLWAQQVPVQEYVLTNGLRLLMIPKKGDPNIAAGWLARVGSVNERPGITGVTHLFEHMMFKGTRVIGTTDIEKELKLMAQLDTIQAGIREEEQAEIRELRLGLECHDQQRLYGLFR
jgi:hypothetical protein